LTTFRLNPGSGTPLYVQLVERLKHSIATGTVKAGEQLPSVRKMAEDLAINPDTVVRATGTSRAKGSSNCDTVPASSCATRSPRAAT
jgi:GntR family transcriptional regulator